MDPDDLLTRCTFAPAGTAVVCAFSGGPDSTALIVLARRAGCLVHAVHVDHGLRPSSVDEARRAVKLAEDLGVTVTVTAVTIAPGPNVEARARAARSSCLPDDVLTGHTADDQAETVLINLLRGAGIAGLAGMRAGPARPLLSLRRHETIDLCRSLGLTPVNDPSNDDPRFVRNRVRHEVIPLLDDVSNRDVVTLLARTAGVLAADADLLDRLARTVDPTDATALGDLEPALARRVVRSWLAGDGYPPDLATVERVLDVAAGAHTACEIGAGRRVERHRQRLSIVAPAQVASADGMGISDQPEASA